MSLEIKFINLVDSTISTEYCGIPYENSSLGSNAGEHLGKFLQDALSTDSDDSISHLQLRYLRDQFILRHIVDEQDLDPYFAILWTILNFVKSRIYSLDNESQWQKAIEAAYLYIKYSKFGREYLETRYKRQVAVGDAANNLKKKGYELTIEDGKVIMTHSEQERLVKELEADIKFLGGVNVVSQLFADANRKHLFDQQQERYHFVRRFSNEPDLPVAYLLNLAVKYPTQSPIFIPGSPSETWKRLIETSTEVTAILDVQPYEHQQVEPYFQTIDTLVEFLQEITVYDSIFTLTQLRSSDVLRILRGLFSWIDRGLFTNKTGLELDHFFDVIETIIQSANHDKKPSYYDFKSLALKMPNIPEQSLRKILDILSHDKSANKDFKLPYDISSVDFHFQFRPLLKTGNNEYIMLNPSWCSPAFYEAIVSYLEKDFDEEIHKKLGHPIEEFIKHEFSQKGISYSYGNYYKGKNIGGELDIVVETSDTIIFIEVKKKVLTREARSGNVIDIFIDLADSLIKAQSQLLKAELLIRDKDCLKLDTDSKIDLNGRNIAKVAITLSDFSGLNDRVIVFLLELIKEIPIDELKSQTTDQETAKKIDKIKKEIIDELSTQVNKINKLDYNNSNNSPFVNSWFLSVPQLLVLLDNVNSNDSLKTELWKTRSVTASTRDFYFEYYYSNLGR